MKYTAKDIANMLDLSVVDTEGIVIEQLLTDSRKLVFPAQTLFFALPGPRRDGHEYIESLYDQGVRCFVVNSRMDLLKQKAYCLDAVFFEVPNCLTALQKIVAHHRSCFKIPVIGITGSNGKTVVKEWLYQLLSPSYHIVRSPRSYNSQIGVPLSVWKMNATHELAIFEAGISTTHEMEHIAPVIKPTIGVLTHMGHAHAEGFSGMQQKIQEKLRLFETVDTIIYGKDLLNEGVDIEADASMFKRPITFYSWSRTAPATLVITS